MIVDLAGETGGNCELTEPGRVVDRHSVTIAAPLNLPASVPEHASQLYARNVQALLELMLDDGRAPHRPVRRDPRRRLRQPRARARGGGGLMLITNLGTLVLAGFVGYLVISKVPNTLHTPLMSGTNAIHGIVIVGGILLLATGAARRRAQQGAAHRRCDVRHDQRRRRLPGHRPDARDVQAPAARGRRVMASLREAALHRELRACSSTGSTG